MKKRVIVCICGLILFFGLAGVTGIEAKRNMIVLSLDQTDEDGLLTFKEYPEKRFGPEDFVLLQEKDILILDAVAKRIQRFTDGCLSQTVLLKDLQGQELFMEEAGGLIYVVTPEQVAEIDLETDDVRFYSYPEGGDELGGLGICIYDVCSRQDQLVLIAGDYGNYTVDRERGAIVPTELGYHAEINDSGMTGSEGENRWEVFAYNTSLELLGYDEAHNLIVRAVNFAVGINSPDYVSIRKYSPDGKILETAELDVSGRYNVPRRSVKMKDGVLYHLLPMKDRTIVEKIALEAEWKLNTSTSAGSSELWRNQ